VKRLLILYILIASNWAVALPNFSNERFGKVNVVGDPAKAERIVILLSSTSKSLTQEFLSKYFSETDFVISIDSHRYLSAVQKEDKGKDCSYLTGEIERLSQSVQNSSGLDEYRKPILLGVEEGAALAAAIYSATPQSFLGFVSLNFCPSINTSIPLCKNDHMDLNYDKLVQKQLLNFSSDTDLNWISIESEHNAHCNLKELNQFFLSLNSIKRELAKANQPGDITLSSFRKNIMDSLDKLSDGSQNENVRKHFPYSIELPSEDSSNDTLAVLLSGDGGWAAIDKGISSYLVQHGVSVVGFDSLKFFWKAKTPEETAAAVSSLAKHYLKVWRKKNLILIGFSMGADVLPFIVTRLSSKMKTVITYVALLSPGLKTDFEVNISDWLGLEESNGTFDIAEEIKKIAASKIICIYGEDEAGGSICPKLSSKEYSIKKFPGSHHFDGDYEGVAKELLSNMTPPANKVAKQN